MEDLNVLDLLKILLIGKKIDIYFYPTQKVYRTYECKNKVWLKKNVIVTDVTCWFDCEGVTYHAVFLDENENEEQTVLKLCQWNVIDID